MFQWRARSVTARVILHAGPYDYDYLLAEGRRRGLLGVGYHFVIDTLGGITSGRPLEAIGSHTPAHNHDSVGVWLGYPFSEAQRKALAGLIFRLECLYGTLSLVGHKELPRTRNPACPALDMDDLRQSIKKENSGLTPSTPDLSTQQQLVVNYLRAGHTLSTQIAMVSLGIMSLSSRVAELRALGFNIESEEARDYHGRRYLKYTLREPVSGTRADTIISDEAETSSADTSRWLGDQLRAGRVVQSARSAGGDASEVG